MQQILANSEAAGKPQSSYLRINHPPAKAYGFRMTLKLHIKEVRIAKGIKQGDLASMIGVSGPHLSEVERGLKKVNNHLLEKLSAALGVPIEALVTSSGSSKAAYLSAIASSLDDENIDRVIAFADALKKVASNSEQN